MLQLLAKTMIERFKCALNEDGRDQKIVQYEFIRGLVKKMVVVVLTTTTTTTIIIVSDD